MRRLFLILLLALAIPFHAQAADMSIDESDLKFDRESVTINPGDTLALINKDEVSHNIQIVDDNGNITDKGLQRSGTEIKIPFSHPGVYKVRCSIYPQMKMSVTVR